MTHRPSQKSRQLNIGVTDFALPSPRMGSIETYSGFGSLPNVGQEIHARIQARRLIENSFYIPERWISHTFSRGRHKITIGGRMDGFIPGTPPTIEEIKTAYQLENLTKSVSQNSNHPYRLQLQTYAYLHYLQTGTLPLTRLHMVCARTLESHDHMEPFNLIEFESWMDRRLEELIQEDEFFEKLKKRRKKSASQLQFPYSQPRPGQSDLMKTIEDHLEKNGRVIIQAPTGLGKTAAVTFPTLKEAMARGQKAIYVTPKNSQHAVAEDTARQLQTNGAKLKSLTFHAKSKLCFKDEVHCQPEYCEFARDHYSKMSQNKITDALAKKKNITAKTVQKIARQFEVCPFELQLEAVSRADLVIADYNYVFSPRNIVGQLSYNGYGKGGLPNLIIDEAHNLPTRANEYFSSSLSAALIDEEVRRASHLEGSLRQDLEGLAIAVRLRIRSTVSETQLGKAVKAEIQEHDFLDLLQKSQEILARYLSSGIPLQKKDPVLSICNMISEFVSQISNQSDPFLFTYSPEGPALKITCFDASTWLKQTYAQFANAVAFSATIKPFDYYSKILGLDDENLVTAEFQSPFPRHNRKLLIIPQISTRLKDRAQNYGKVKDVIERIVRLKAGNYFVFFPSFDFLHKVSEELSLPEFEILKQSREMKRDHIEDYIGKLRSQDKPTLILAVQGGVFAEGIDYPGEMLIGALIVGPALPTFDFERESLREYFETKYGNGFDYAYTYPAMAKVIQSAGRVIRSSTDKGLIVLMDRRFMHGNYLKSMPVDWGLPNTLVSNQILKDIGDFWNACGEKQAGTENVPAEK